MLRFFKELVHAFWSELRQMFSNGFRLQDPKAELEQELRIMYGRGEISKEMYTQMRYRLYWGQIGSGDVQMLRQANIKKMQAQGRLPVEVANPELARNLDQLFADRVLLEETRNEIEDRRKTLQREIDWIREQAESARLRAKESLPDEDTARTYLGVWQDMQVLSKDLEARRQALEANLRQVNLMDAELKASITKLKLLHSQEHLSELNLQVQHDLLPDGRDHRNR